MRFPIDVLFVNRDGTVVKVVRNLGAWRIAGAFGAHAAIEFAAGAIPGRCRSRRPAVPRRRTRSGGNGRQLAHSCVKTTTFLYSSRAIVAPRCEAASSHGLDDAGMALERRLDDSALDSSAAAVNQAHLESPRRPLPCTYSSTTDGMSFG